MEDVKWLKRKWGILFAVLFIAVIVCSMYLGHNGKKTVGEPEEVWEPPVEIASNETEAIPHASLRQYWRTKPISDECRELTKKYISGLSYVNYNMLVTDWNSSNIEDILMPCMFEDIYRIYTTMRAAIAMSMKRFLQARIHPLER